MLTRFVVASAAVLVVTTSQEPAPRRLTTAAARYDGDFAAISGARELRDGRVLVSDFKEPALFVIDMKSGTATRLGRKGQGPNEFIQPGGMYAGPGDTTFVLDRGQQRALVVSPAGQIVGMRSIELHGTSYSSSQDLDRQRLDGQARPYYVENPSMRDMASGKRDSLRLVRLNVASQTRDTLAALRGPESKIVSANGPMTMSRMVLFSAQDAWGVAPDARIAVVRATPYRIDWIEASGSVTSGPPIAYTPIPVSAADREATIASFGKGSTATIGTRGPSGNTTKQMTMDPSETLFADAKPAFDPQLVIVAPDGRVFVGRHRAASETRVLYDVFDRKGARVDRIELPPRSKIIGFGAGSIYVAERDEDDVPKLRKYTL